MEQAQSATDLVSFANLPHCYLEVPSGARFARHFTGVLHKDLNSVKMAPVTGPVFFPVFFVVKLRIE